MAEPSTSTLVVASAGIGLATLFPGIDGNALIGAFAGAALLVVSSKDLTLGTRGAYMVISMIIGYLAAPEVLNWTPVRSTGVAAFFAAASAIVLTLQLLERLKTMDVFKLFKKGE